jgi:hypothetical protein
MVSIARARNGLLWFSVENCEKTTPLEGKKKRVVC